jgi:hypothetical protein
VRICFLNYIRPINPCKMKHTNLQCKELTGIIYSTKISRWSLNGLLIAFMALLITGGKLNSQIVYNESFDGTTFVPTGWTNLVVSGTPAWSRVTSGVNPSQSPHSGAGEAMFNSYNVSSGTRALITPPFSLSNNTSGAAVSFWMYRDNGYNTTADQINVYYNTSANLTGATLMGTVNRAIGLSPTVTANGWYQYSYTIPSTLTASSVYLILSATSQYGNNIFIDDVSWTAYPTTCSGTPNTPTLSIASASGCPSGLSISASGVTPDAGISNQWQISPTSGGTYTNISGATGLTYNGPQSSTAFYQLVSTCTVSGLSATSTPVSYTVVNPGPCVCTTYGSSAAQYSGDEDILNVVFGTLSNSSTCSSTGPGPGSVNQLYSNYAGFVAAPVICMGASIPFTVNINTCNGWYGMQLKIFIDFNQNGSFTDSGEQVFYTSAAVQGNTTGSVLIPLTAIPGVTRMRLVAAEGQTPPATGSYYYGETEDYCVNITAPPTVAISANTGSVCPGASQTITASGASTYSINGGPGLVSASNITLSPLVNTIYTVTGTSSNGCVSPMATAPQATLTTLASPSISIASPTGICIGSTTTLTASGANTYTWSNNTVSTSIVVNPTSTTVYSVSGTGTNVCNGVKTLTLAVNPLPTVSVNSGTFCAGQVFTMAPTGAATYSFSGGSNTVSPTSNSTYSVTGYSSQGCVSAAPAVSSVTVVALPVVSVAGGTICEGGQLVLLTSGAFNYTFSGGNPVSPNVTTSYSVTGTNSTGCVSLPAVATVTVYNNPTVTATTSSSVTCSGSPIDLIATGALTYTWNTGANTASTTASPTVNTNFYVIGADSNQCISYVTLPVTVNPVPNVVIATTATFICLGNTATLTASGALSYTWNNTSTLTSIPVTPSVTTTYSVTGTNTFGCTKTVMRTVNVNSLTLATSGNTAVCQGGPVTLSASGVNSYTWSNNSPFASIVVSPSVTTSYTVNGTGNGCPFSQVVVVTVNPKPTVTASSSHTMICVNESATLTAGGASSYTWSHGDTGASVVVTPSINITFNYTAIGVDANGCSNTSSAVSLIVDKCTGLSELQGSLSVNVYPNPTNGEFVIELANGLTKSINVTDVTGRIILSETSDLDKSTLNLTHFANGVYYVKIKSGNGAEVIRVVKQ